MITLTDSQREYILQRTSSLIDDINFLHSVIATSKNISDVELQNWYKVISQTTAKAEDIDSKMRFIESKSK